MTEISLGSCPMSGVLALDIVFFARHFANYHGNGLYCVDFYLDSLIVKKVAKFLRLKVVLEVKVTENEKSLISKSCAASCYPGHLHSN